MTNNMVMIDGKKLQAELKKRGVSFASASKELGFGVTYLTNSASRGYMRTAAIKALFAEYNINPDAYVLKESEPAEEKVAAVDYNELYKVIYTAVYEAVKKAWSE